MATPVEFNSNRLTYGSFSLTLTPGQLGSTPNLRTQIQRLVRGQNVEIRVSNFSLQFTGNTLVLRTPNIVQIFPLQARQILADWLLSMLAYQQRIQTLLNAANLPRDVQILLLLRLDYEDILRVCADVEALRGLCSSQLLWEQKAIQFGTTQDEFRRGQREMSPRERYVELLSYYGDRCVEGSEAYISVELCTLRSAHTGDLTSLRYFLKLTHGTNPDRAKELAQLAVRRGDFNMLRYLQQTYPSVNLMDRGMADTLNIAAERGYSAIIEYLVAPLEQAFSRNLDFLVRVYTDILVGAVRGGQNEILERYLSRLQALNLSQENLVDEYARLAAAAIRKGDTALFNRFFIPELQSIRGLATLIDAAAEVNNRELLNRLVSMSPEYSIGTIFTSALSGGHIELAREFLPSVRFFPRYVQALYAGVLEENNLEAARFLVAEPSIPKLDPRQLNSLLTEAADAGNIAAVDFIIESGANNISISQAFLGSLARKRYRMVRHLYRTYRDRIDFARMKGMFRLEPISGRFLLQLLTPEDAALVF